MSDFIVLDGDTVMFQPSFGAATVVPLPGTISGTGKPTMSGTPVCIEGDEGSVEVAGCMYMTPQYSIPGTGTLKIDALSDDQIATHTTSEGVPVILVGTNFEAIFEVQSPAQQPPPGPGAPIPDSKNSYTGGMGMFISSNTKFKGT